MGTILIIDDDRLNSKMLRNGMSNMGHDVICAFTARLKRSWTRTAMVPLKAISPANTVPEYQGDARLREKEFLQMVILTPIPT
ncbi:MAG: hypothetical protein ACLP9S_12170 [Syntrophales bacterium]|jgi:DNA-binding response OmpR family regulator